MKRGIVLKKLVLFLFQINWYLLSSKSFTRTDCAHIYESIKCANFADSFTCILMYLERVECAEWFVSHFLEYLLFLLARSTVLWPNMEYFIAEFQSKIDLGLMQWWDWTPASVNYFHLCELIREVFSFFIMLWLFYKICFRNLRENLLYKNLRQVVSIYLT